MLSTSKMAVAGFAPARMPTRSRSACTVQALWGGKQKQAVKQADKSAKKAIGTVSTNFRQQTKKYSNQNQNAIPLEPGFTKKNEQFVGRMAMLGFFSAIVGEAYTHKGILGQVSEAFNAPVGTVEAAFWFIALSAGLYAALPFSKTFEEENQESLKNRRGPVQDPRINPITEPKKFLGISGFGFTKPNEIFVGRVAMLGFVAALVGEKLTGKGPIAQLGLENYTYAGAGLAIFIAAVTAAAIGTGRYGGEEYNDELY